jgi:arsenite/tail-anchored protein-transporting ATPase
MSTTEARWTFFGGKGGVGKTTCAAAAAVRAAREGAHVLVVSSDPAHSLADALDVRLGPEPREIAPRLWAAELDADRALDRWIGERENAIRTVAERGTYLDREDIDSLLSLSFPGADELVGLIELLRLSLVHRVDEVVVDTAPTGHTLRLLAMPDTLERIAEILDDMHAKHRFLASSLGRWRPDFADAAIDAIADDARALRMLLHERSLSFTWVTLPEALPYRETRRGIRALRAMGIRLGRVVVNRVWPAPDRPCPLCTPRVVDESRWRRRYRRRYDVLEMPALLTEPRGLAALAAFANGREPLLPAARKRLTEDRTTPVRRLPLRLCFFGGKGGVGKTTAAAATSIDLAEHLPGRVLVLSTDPAHSLGDALGIRLGDVPTPILPNLDAREVDASLAWNDLRERYRRGVEDLFATMFRGAVDASFDRAALEGMLDLAPPGIDELIGILAMVDALEDGAYAHVIVDTAPTGHTLRLLTLPERALAWVHALMRIVLKYRSVFGLGELASDLTDLARRLRMLIALLADRERCGFVVVTRPAELPMRETERLVAALGKASVPLAGVLVNAVTAPSCSRCAGAAALEAPWRTKLTHTWEAPALHPGPRGVDALRRFRATWRARE